MSSITRVRNRDGREAPFDEERIVRSIYEAGKDVGKPDIVVARELSGVVTLFLERRHWETVPHVDDIQDMVERVLLETGHVEIARAYIREREARTRESTAPAGLRTVPLFPETALRVSPASGKGVSNWDRSRIVSALEREASLDRDQAESIAEAVEGRILGEGVERISSRLVRSLVDAELFSRGLVDRIPTQAVVGVPGYDLKRWMEEADHPGGVARRVAERAMSEFAFGEVFSRDVAMAHAAGRIHIVGVEYPMLIHSAYLTLECVKKFGDTPWEPQDSVIPEDLGSLRDALRRVVGEISRYVRGTVDVGYLNLMAAPLVGEEDPQTWAGALLSALESPGTGIPPLVTSAEIVGGVPDFLRFTDAVGRGGIRLGRGYQEFWTDAERLTRSLVDALGRSGGEGQPALYFHVDGNTFRNPSSLSLVRALCAEVSRGLPLTFVFERDGNELRVHGRHLTRVEDPRFFRNPESMRIPFLQMVVINAAQAAYRAGRGNMKGFTDELEAALQIATRAQTEKARFLASLSGEFGGPLSRLNRRMADGRPLLDLARGEFLLSVCGFPEAMAYLGGEDAGGESQALKLATQAAPFLSMKANEEARKASIRSSLVGPCPVSAAARLFEADLSAYPQAVRDVAPDRYRTDLLLREEMPHDLLQAIRVTGSLYSLIEPCVTIGGLDDLPELDSEGLFDLACEVFERTEMTYLRFRRGKTPTGS
ncbi:MAG: anaerobic ribonucleoside-triphosphate reductase [Planctomycetota bacterium]